MIPLQIVEGLDEAFDLFDPAFPLAMDTETIGLYGKVRTIQFYQKHLSHVVMVENPDLWQLVGHLIHYKFVGHNIHYDLTTVQTGLQYPWIPSNFEDTFLLARLAIPQCPEFSLDAVMEFVLGYDPYKKQGLNKATLQKSNWAAPSLTQAQLQYAATDVFYLLDVYDAVKSAETTTSYQLDMLTLKYCLDIQWNGLPIDKVRLADKVHSLEAQVADYNVPINVNSWQQVRPYIGESESDGLALATFWLRDGNMKAKKVMEVRSLLKQLSFLAKFDRSEERIYGKFQPSAKSGRLTSKDQNLQQLPRALKCVFGVDLSMVLIYADYAQIELRTICAITQCKAMEQLFRDEKDLHSYTAEMIFGPTWQKKPHRQIAKTCNFNLLYGGGVKMFLSILIETADLLLTELEGNVIRKKWRNLWKEIYAWQERGISAWRKGKLGRTPLGRPYRADLMTDQLNLENQGAAAEVFKLALHYFKRRTDVDHDVVKICNMIHDSFILEAPNDPEVYQHAAVALAESMQEAWFEMSKLFKITDLPMPVDVAVGFNWSDIEDETIDNVWDFSLDPYKMLEKVNATV